jgi:hypothetical protein
MYVNQKTMISIVTAVIVASILGFCDVPLAAMFGLLTFLLNYIPNVGSVAATFLPIPIMIMTKMHVEQQVKFWIAIGVPMTIQFSVGNVIEPIVLGNALNLGSIQVLAALVFWGVIWNLPGAIISTPLLSIMKIFLEHSNHRMARETLRYIAQDPDKKKKEETAVKDLIFQIAQRRLSDLAARITDEYQDQMNIDKAVGLSRGQRAQTLRVHRAVQAAMNNAQVPKGEAPTTNLIYVCLRPNPLIADPSHTIKWTEIAKTLQAAIGVEDLPVVFDNVVEGDSNEQGTYSFIAHPGQEQEVMHAASKIFRISKSSDLNQIQNYMRHCVVSTTDDHTIEIEDARGMSSPTIWHGPSRIRAVPCSMLVTVDDFQTKMRESLRGSDFKNDGDLAFVVPTLRRSLQAIDPRHDDHIDETAFAKAMAETATAAKDASKRPTDEQQMGGQLTSAIGMGEIMVASGVVIATGVLPSLGFGPPRTVSGTPEILRIRIRYTKY